MNAVLRRTFPYALSAPVLTAAATVLAGAGVLAGPAVTAALGGMLLGFVLPGLALTGLLFRRRTLTAVDRTVLAPALSRAVLIVSGLILYVAGVRLDRTAWTLAAAGTTLAVLAAGAVSGRLRPATEDQQPGPPPGPFAPWAPKQRVTAAPLARQLAPMMLVLALLAGAGYLSHLSSAYSYDVTVTTLSAVPPGPADGSGRRVVRLSASGLLAEDGPYTVAVTGPDGTRLAERTVPVPDSGSWQANLRLPAADRLTVRLFRAGDTVAYRTLLIAAAE
ncbi:MAG TPA: hypothetical protein VFH03_01050 [Actinoplanes sp.]|nr:hypothetical protein [Actinoplanes sp.]